MGIKRGTLSLKQWLLWQMMKARRQPIGNWSQQTNWANNEKFSNEILICRSPSMFFFFFHSFYSVLIKYCIMDNWSQLSKMAEKVEITVIAGLVAMANELLCYWRRSIGVGGGGRCDSRLFDWWEDLRNTLWSSVNLRKRKKEENVLEWGIDID